MQKKITRFKKQPDVDERRVQFPSVRNGREMMMFLVKIGKAGEKKKKTALEEPLQKWPNRILYKKSIAIFYLTFTMSHGQFNSNNAPQLTLDK